MCPCSASWEQQLAETTQQQWAYLRLCFLYFALQIWNFYSYKLKFYGDLAPTKFISTIFPTFVHLCVCHILIVHIERIFQTSLLLYLLWWPVFSDLWCNYYKLGGHQKPGTYKMVNITDKCFLYSDCPTDKSVILHSLSLSLDLLITWDITILKLCHLGTLKWPLTAQVKGRVACHSL